MRCSLLDVVKQVCSGRLAQFHFSANARFVAASGFLAGLWPLRLPFWHMEPKEDRGVEDARVMRQGRYSAWLKKAKSENARCKLLQSHNIRCPRCFKR